MTTLAPHPTLVAVSPLELATVASRLGLEPWSPVARRAVGLEDVEAVTREACGAALVGLVARGLVAPAAADGAVEIHPAVVAVVATLARASVLVEAIAADGSRRAMALVPGTGGLLVDAGPEGILLVALLDTDVPVDDAVATLREDGTGDVRVVTAAGSDLAAPVPGERSWPST